MDELGVRHVPVVDAGRRLVGLVTARDLLRRVGPEPAGASLVSVDQVMTADVRSVTPDDGIGRAARVMIEAEVTCLPVVEAGRLVGMLTERDFVRHLSRVG
jgi:CBS domain-containing membrane protein